jgi:branched-subunit amino acid aminotransferase/4-amino-4-deoxychorismate lyase
MFWQNGRLSSSQTLTLAIDNPGWLYGATVFTTVRVYDRTLQHPLTNWNGHCDRLRRSILDFGWQHPNWENLRQGAQTLLAHYPILRITVFPDGGEVITGRSLPADLERRQRDGICAWLADEPQFQRTLAAHKTGNYLSAWLALQTARKMEAEEAILSDRHGNWLETSTGNLWGWQQGCWWTPPLEADSLEGWILPGLLRSQLLACLQQRNLPVIEQPWTAELVQGFEAIAYTNSVVEIVPIHTVVTSASTALNKSGDRSWHYNPHHSQLAQLRDELHAAGNG